MALEKLSWQVMRSPGAAVVGPITCFWIWSCGAVRTVTASGLPWLLGIGAGSSVLRTWAILLMVPPAAATCTWKLTVAAAPDGSALSVQPSVLASMGPPPLSALFG